jgi:hypothetical protein
MPRRIHDLLPAHARRSVDAARIRFDREPGHAPCADQDGARAGTHAAVPGCLDGHRQVQLGGEVPKFTAAITSRARSANEHRGLLRCGEVVPDTFTVRIPCRAA